MKLEIVSHCWQYGRLLTYQLSSLILHPPQHVAVQMTVFFSETDAATCGVLEYFGRLSVPAITWNWRNLEEPRLFRRAIGRNLAALETEADWIWFADADMCFGGGCLDTLATAVQDCSAPLVYPRHIRISKTHRMGDETIDRASGPPQVLSIEEQEFGRITYGRAIGGVQICRGDVAREKGYCSQSRRFQSPAARWCKCTEDRAFRITLGTRGVPIKLPNLYRIRHSQRGRTHVGIQL